MSEPSPSLYENADFSLDTVQALIKEGELKTNQILKDIKISSLYATIPHYRRNDFSKRKIIITSRNSNRKPYRLSALL
jgi:hypothetical protein